MVSLALLRPIAVAGAHVCFLYPVPAILHGCDQAPLFSDSRCDSGIRENLKRCALVEKDSKFACWSPQRIHNAAPGCLSQVSIIWSPSTSSQARKSTLCSADSFSTGGIQVSRALNRRTHPESSLKNTSARIFTSKIRKCASPQFLKNQPMLGRAELLCLAVLTRLKVMWCYVAQG